MAQHVQLGKSIVASHFCPVLLDIIQKGVNSAAAAAEAVLFREVR
jgi:hypothetical protein